MKITLCINLHVHVAHVCQSALIFLGSFSIILPGPATDLCRRIKIVVGYYNLRK